MCRFKPSIRYVPCGCEVFEDKPEYCAEVINSKGGSEPWIRSIAVGQQYETQLEHLSGESNIEVLLGGYRYRVISQHSHRGLIHQECQNKTTSDRTEVRSECPWHDWLLAEDYSCMKREAARKRIKAKEEAAKEKREKRERSLLGKGAKALKKIVPSSEPDEPKWKPRSTRQYRR